MSHILVLFMLLALIGCSVPENKPTAESTGLVNLKQMDKVVEMDNGLVKARFSVGREGISQEYFAKKSDKWILVIESFRPPKQWPGEAPPLYNSSVDKKNRLILTEALDTIRAEEISQDKATITLKGSIENQSIIQTVILEKDNDFFHIEVDAVVTGDPPTVEYVLSPFVFNLEKKPDFIHTPSLKGSTFTTDATKRTHNEPDQIFGDRTFYAPAVILQNDGLFAALVPDLEIINKYKVLSPNARFAATRTEKPLDIPFAPGTRSMPTGLDFTLLSGLTEKPLMSYGIIDAVATHHMHWPHPSDGSMVRQLADNKLKYGFDLFVSADASRYRGYQRISRHQWARFGRETFQKPRPQAMPFEEYAKICLPAGLSYQGWWVERKGKEWILHHEAPKGYPNMDSWQEWEMNGWPVGGHTNNAPQWYDFIEYATWWNNMRDAVGMYWWGKRLNNPSLVDKAERIVNLILLAPQNKGVFPCIYKAYHKRWQGNHWNPPMEIVPDERERYFDDNSKSYQTAAMSKTAAHMLRYYRLCQANDRIIPFVKSYGDFIVNHIDTNGCLPAWFSANLKPNPHLRFNGEQGVHIWFLSELYMATENKRYIDAAEIIAKFMMTEILPKQRWLDYEVYFSCGVKSMNYSDPYTGQDPRGTISMSWAAEGFAALYRATKNKIYLDAGEQVIDYLSLYQTVWAPHYIYTAYPFGGTDTDNGDAAWLNGHQAMLPGIFAWYGKELGRADLLERSVALARASLVLTNLERHVKNNIYNYPNYPKGMGPENIDHEGIPQTPLRTGASWCELGGLTGASDAMRELGGIYVNVQKNIAVGLDGVRLKKFEFKDRTIRLTIQNHLKNLIFPYEKSFDTNLKIEGLPDTGTYMLIINGGKSLQLSEKELSNSRLKIKP